MAEDDRLADDAHPLCWARAALRVCSPPHFEVRSCAEADIALHSVTAKSKYFIRRILPVRSQDDVGGAAFIVRADSHPRHPEDWQSRPPVAATDFSLPGSLGTLSFAFSEATTLAPAPGSAQPASPTTPEAMQTRTGARTRCNFMRTFRWMGSLAGGSGCAADAAANARWRPLAAQGHVRGERAPPRFRRGSPLRPRATYVPIRGRRDGAGRCRCRYWPARIQAAQAQFRRVKAGDQMKMTIAQAIAVRKG